MRIASNIQIKRCLWTTLSFSLFLSYLTVNAYASAYDNNTKRSLEVLYAEAINLALLGEEGHQGATTNYFLALNRLSDDLREQERVIAIKILQFGGFAAGLEVCQQATDILQLVSAPIDEGARVMVHECKRELQQFWFAYNRADRDHNPRVIDHLRRVAFVQGNYCDLGNLTCDDRAEAYLKFGAPTRVIPINYNDFALRQAANRLEINVSMVQFRSSEIWIYYIPGNEIVYVFTDVNGSYRVGTIEDMLPTGLVNSVSNSTRGQQRAAATTAAIRWLLEKLSLQLGEFSGLYSEVDRLYQVRNAFARMNSLQGGNSALPTTGFYDESDIETFGTVGMGNAPSYYFIITQVVGQLRERDRQIARRNSSVDELDFGRWNSDRNATLFTMRRLGPSRSNRLRIMWTVPSYSDRHALQLTSQSTIVAEVYLAYYDSDLALLRRDLVADNVINDSASVFYYEGEMMGQYSHVVATVKYNHVYNGVALQEISRSQSVENDRQLLSESSIGISDVMPFMVDDVVVGAQVMRDGYNINQLVPIINGNLRDAAAIGLYFEIYDLTGRRGDYLINYQVVKRRDGSIFQRSREDTAIFQSQRHFEDGNRPAAFLLDRAQWEGADEVEIVVTVLDPDSGDSVERRITFDNRR